MLMPFILWIAAILEFFGGLGVLLSAKSAIHEILGVLAIGFSFMTLGLASVITEIRQATKSKLLANLAEDIAAIRSYYDPNS
jgi:hypothetical protein